MFSVFNDMITQFMNTPGSEYLVYVLLGTIIFVETGLVIFPFLPGDSILFFVGSIIAMHPGRVSLPFLIILLGTLAFLANTLNYEIGKHFGNRLPNHPRLSKLIKPKYIEEAKKFFEKYGSLAIFLGRFMPIIRTVVPFTAGTSQMPYRKFVWYNLAGGFAWITIAVMAGFFFGGLPFVKAHFELIMVAIIVVSLLPVIITGLKSYLQSKKQVNQ